MLIQFDAYGHIIPAPEDFDPRLHPQTEVEQAQAYRLAQVTALIRWYQEEQRRKAQPSDDDAPNGPQTNKLGELS